MINHFKSLKKKHFWSLCYYVARVSVRIHFMKSRLWDSEFPSSAQSDNWNGDIANLHSWQITTHSAGVLERTLGSHEELSGWPRRLWVTLGCQQIITHHGRHVFIIHSHTAWQSYIHVFNEYRVNIINKLIAYYVLGEFLVGYLLVITS